MQSAGSICDRDTFAESSESSEGVLADILGEYA